MGSHAMSLAFISIFTALNLPQTTIPLLFFVFSSLSFRVKTKLHTKKQIYVGLLLGAINGYVWNGLTTGTFALLPTFNLADFITDTFLPANGVFPIYQLWLPALVGASTVGSVER